MQPLLTTPTGATRDRSGPGRRTCRARDPAHYEPCGVRHRGIGLHRRCGGRAALIGDPEARRAPWSAADRVTAARDRKLSDLRDDDVGVTRIERIDQVLQLAGAPYGETWRAARSVSRVLRGQDQRLIRLARPYPAVRSRSCGCAMTTSRSAVLCNARIGLAASKGSAGRAAESTFTSFCAMVMLPRSAARRPEADDAEPYRVRRLLRGSRRPGP